MSSTVHLRTECPVTNRLWLSRGTFEYCLQQSNRLAVLWEEFYAQCMVWLLFRRQARLERAADVPRRLRFGDHWISCLVVCFASNGTEIYGITLFCCQVVSFECMDPIRMHPSAQTSLYGLMFPYRQVNTIVNNPNSTGYIPPPAWGPIHGEVLSQCDTLDGVQDSVISSPGKCFLDFAKFACGGNSTVLNSTTCLTAPQVSTLRGVYTNWTSNGELVFPAFNVGSESLFAVSVNGQPFGPAPQVCSAIRVTIC